MPNMNKPENEQHDVVTRSAARRARETLFEVTPEQQEWFRLAGFSRMEWQRLIYARWRYQQGDLTEYPQGW